MTKFKIFGLAAALVFLNACGEASQPVALEIVNQNEVAGGLAEPLTLLESVIQQGVPEYLATVALQKYDEFAPKVRNPNYITMIDFSRHSGAKRFFLVERATGKVEATMTAHGVNSDPDRDGYAQYFSNTPNSRKSSLGSYIVEERYVGKHGASLRMDGLEATNSNARARAVVLHSAKYVADEKNKQGMSWGCPAVARVWIDRVIERLRDGSFLYAYGINKETASMQNTLLDQMVNWPGYKWVDEAEEAPLNGEGEEGD